MKHYTQLTRKERYQNYVLKTAGQSKVQNTKFLTGTNPSLDGSWLENPRLDGKKCAGICLESCTHLNYSDIFL